MKETKTATTDIIFDIGYECALKVFGAPYQYLPWTEQLACKIIACYVYTVMVVRAWRTR